jgi:UDP:flavonoid glycosyltransferase YjiC (YdhE family)
MAKITIISSALKGAASAAVKLATNLRVEGHTVGFLGMADCAPLVEPYGFSFRTTFEAELPCGTIKSWLAGPTSRSMGEQLKFLLAERRKMIAHARFVEALKEGRRGDFDAALAEEAPDLVLIDTNLHAYWALLTHRCGVRAAYFSPVLPMGEDAEVPPLNSLRMAGVDTAERDQVRRLWATYFAQRERRIRLMRLAGVPDWIAQVRRLAQACGYPADRLNTRTMLMPMLDWPTLILCPADFEFPVARSRAGRCYAEAGIDLGRREPEFPWERLDHEKKLVYASLGSVAYNRHFLQQTIDAAAREAGWQLVLTIGSKLTPADFSNVPATAILVATVPQLKLLERVAVMINHGGIGTVKECIWFGVPQVVFPVGFDQPGAAARVMFHGLGEAGDFAKATTDSIHALTSKILVDPSYRVRAQAMGESFQRQENEHLAARYLEGLLESQSAVFSRDCKSDDEFSNRSA